MIFLVPPGGTNGHASILGCSFAFILFTLFVVLVLYWRGRGE